MRTWRNLTVVVGAIAAIAAFGWPAAATSPAAEPIELPDALSGALTGLDLPEAYPETVNARTVEQRIADRRAADEFNAAGYSEALGGVPAAARLYAPPDLTQSYSVVAVRAALSPLLPIDFVDPAPLGIEKPSTEFVMDGDVSCLVGWAVIPAGEEPTDADRQWVMCQATDDDVTVRINANTGETPEHLAELAAEVVTASS